MKFKILTLFPEMVLNGLNTSIIGKATQNKFIEIDAVNIRDFTQDKHGKVDDYTYGGGAGMLMQAQPVFDAWNAARGDKERPRTVYVTPQGKTFTQKIAVELSKEEEVIFLCGHYEGIDARVLDEIVTDYISIGDYVLTGGELPAMVMIDAISRLVPGVLHNDESAETESFHRDLLEYPQYSRPEVWHGKEVPKVLLSGDHKKIESWRLEQSVALTKERRPDLYQKYLQQEEVIGLLSKNKRKNIHLIESLRRGLGEIIVQEPGMLFVYERALDLGMFSVQDESFAQKLIEKIPQEYLKNLKFAMTDSETINSLLYECSNLQLQCECKQVCYTQKNTLPVKHKDIRLLGSEHLDYVSKHYDLNGVDYIRNRIEEKALFGAFVEDRLVGFMGWHIEGSLGMLFVEESYRQQKIGASLEAYCINRQLEMGFVPYGHVKIENATSFVMQEKMGLYCSKENLWWLEEKL